MIQKREQFKFNGNERKYFILSIKNFLLSIITLGLYSPWGKVQKKKYLIQNLSFDGATFDYHADPYKILLGRILLISIFSATYLGFLFYPDITSMIAPIIFFIALPFLILKSFEFIVNNTSYQNIHFKFRQDFKLAYKKIFTTPIVIYYILSFMIYSPLYFKLLNGDVDLNPDELLPVSMDFLWVFGITGIVLFFYTFYKATNYIYSCVNYFYNNIYYGNVKIDLKVSKSKILKKIIFPIVCYYVTSFSLGLINSILLNNVENKSFLLVTTITTSVVITLALIYLVILIPFNYKKLIWNNSAINGQTSKCTLDFLMYRKLYFINFFFSFISLGLYAPFAVIKMQRLKWSKRSIELKEKDLSSSDNMSSHNSSLTEVISDDFIFDFEVSL